jgi:hypothetical protein
MILDLGNGRELKLPDDTSDETARQLGRLILVLEDRAIAAERTAADLQTQIDELRREVRQPVEVEEDDSEDDGEEDAPEDDALVMAIQRMEDSLAKRMDKMLRATLADRIMVPDELGTPRSRVVLSL